MTSNAAIHYDSDKARRPLRSEFQNLWEYRGLIRLLVGRELTLRYKRSALGVWWTLLNPLATMTVLWVVFGQFFRFEMQPPTLPYVVYLLSGLIVVTFVSQGVIAAGSAMVNNAAVLSKVYVPPEVFSFSAAVASAANFIISLVPLLVIQLISGAGIPWTVILIPIPLLALLMLVAGLGLLVAAAAVFFFDVLDLTGVVMQLLVYLTPTFYPLSIVPERFLWVIYANPLFSYLEVFRGFVYGGEFAPLWNWLVMGGVSTVVFLGGVWVFSKSWRNLVVLL